MGRGIVSEWRKLPLSLTELCIDTTLRCGQSFRWRKINDEWSCTLYGRIVSLKQDPSHLHYRVTWPENLSKSRQSRRPSSVRCNSGSAESIGDDTEALLRHYLSLKVDLRSLYKQWSKADPIFQKKAPKFTGVRILSQDSWETLISFICSSNNNISRISQMVSKLCSNYGPLIGYVGEEPLYDFPVPEALTGVEVESQLRDLGFGYRAKYIAQTARIVAGKPPSWLDSLRNPETPSFLPITRTDANINTITYKDAHQELLQLSGVGPKVADCVCLMGLGWAEAVPIDTHVWQIAQRDYKYGKGKAKTFSTSMYDSVGDFFRQLWGKEAGWAHSVLFTADLRAFSDRNTKTEEVVTEIKKELEDDKMVVSKKRRRMVETIVKEEDGSKSEILEMESSAKRRSTRSRKSKS